MASHAGEGGRVLLMGCGSIGGVIASGLLRAGHDLTIVTHNEEISRALGADGLRITTPAGQRTVPLSGASACTYLDQVEGPFDVALLAMKATGVEQAARDVAAYRAPEGYVVTLQNGVAEDRVGRILGRKSNEFAGAVWDDVAPNLKLNGKVEGGFCTLGGGNDASVCLLKVSPVRGGKDEACRLVTVVDMTDRHRVEEALRQSE